METLRLGAKAEGTNAMAGLQKKGFLGFTPMGPDTLEKKAWLFLQANSERGRLSPGAKEVVESLDRTVARLQLRLNEACEANYPISERVKMDKLLSVYKGTFEQLRIYGGAFASLCGPSEILAQKSADVKNSTEQQLQKTGFAGFLEKNVLPVAVGALTGGAAATSGFASWAAAKLLGLVGAAGPSFLQNSAALIDIALACAAVGLVAAVSKYRVRAIEKRRIASMQAIGDSEQEIKKAIVGLVVLEYQRLATKNSIKVGLPVESESTIHRKMEQLVFGVKKKHGFELPLPAEVERAVWPLLHRKHESRLEKAWQLLHAHLEILFGRHGGGERANSGQHFEPKTCCIDTRNQCAVA
jgi:hypothetical protein